MTLLEYAHNWYDVFQNRDSHLNFKYFVESLERPHNKPLIESITKGINVILEAKLGFDLGTIKNSSSEFTELIKSGDMQAILGYALPLIYRLVQEHYSDNTNKTETLLTNAVNYVSNNWKKLLDYDGSTRPSTFLLNWVLKPAKSTTQEQTGQYSKRLNEPHEYCCVTYNDIWDDANGIMKKISEYGVIKNPESKNGYIQVTWKKGPKEGTTTHEMYDELTFYDLNDDEDNNVSINTKEYANDIVDNSYDIEIFGKNVTDEINRAISEVADTYEDQGFTEIKSLKALLHDAIFSLLDMQIRAEIAKKINSIESNMKYRNGDKEKANTELAKAREELSKMDEIRKNAPNKSTFGEKYGIKHSIAKGIWKEFIDVLKHQPTILQWIKNRK